jgi:hypothetical protein
MARVYLWRWARTRRLTTSGSGRITPEGIPSYEETGFTPDQMASAQASDQGNLPPTPSQAAPITQNIG